jgi:hypothetical protein
VDRGVRRKWVIKDSPHSLEIFNPPFRRESQLPREGLNSKLLLSFLWVTGEKLIVFPAPINLPFNPWKS